MLRIIEYSLDILWFISYFFCTLSFFLLHLICFFFCFIILYIYRCLYTMELVSFNKEKLSFCRNKEGKSWRNEFLVFSIDSSYIYIQEG